MTDFPTVDIEEWRERVEQELGGVGPDSLATETLDGIRLAPLYTRSDRDDTGLPGSWPFTRGSRATPHDPPWVICQRVADPDPGIAAAQIEEDRRGGVTGIWLRLDRAGRFGLDPRQEEAADHAGLEGVAAYDAEDLAALLGACGDTVASVRIDAGGNTLPVAALLVAAGDRMEGPLPEPRFGMDPLGSLAADGGLPDEPVAMSREMAVLVRWCEGAGTAARALAVDVSRYAQGGAGAALQLALGLATAAEYMRWLEAHGVEPEVTARQIDFVFETDRHLLIEICKLRAMRSLWSRMQTACGFEARRPYVHAATGWRTLTRRDPWTNMLRATVQCAAAILGGADAITTVPFDAPLGRPREPGRRVARNTQIILAEESGLGAPVDPLGGAYAAEAVTRELCRRGWELFRELEASGGLLACLRDGQVATMLQEGLRARASRLAGDTEDLLGVTVYPPEDGDVPERERVDPAEIRARAVERLDTRRAAAGAPALPDLGGGSGAGGLDDIWEALVAAAGEGATIAELGSALRPGRAPVRRAAIPGATDEELALESASPQESPA